jgi:hypothetical protein
MCPPNVGNLLLTLAPHFCMRRVSASECHTKSPSFRFSYSKICAHTSYLTSSLTFFETYLFIVNLYPHLCFMYKTNISRRRKFTFRSSGLWHRDRSFRGTCCRLLQRWYANILKEILATRLHGFTTRKNVTHNRILIGITFSLSEWLSFP